MSDITIELFKKYYKRNTILHKDFDEIDDLYIGFKNGYELSIQQLKDAEEKIEIIKNELCLINDASYKNGMFYVGDKSIFPNGWYTLKEFMALLLKEIE